MPTSVIGRAAGTSDAFGPARPKTSSPRATSGAFLEHRHRVRVHDVLRSYRIGLFSRPAVAVGFRPGRRVDDTRPVSAGPGRLQQELDRFNASLGLVTRRAGRGLDYDFERRLDAHRRMLSDMLGPDGTPLVMDTVIAAKSALNASEPFHDLQAMARAQETLGRLVRRQAIRLRG